MNTTDLLAPTTTMGAVTLRVADLDAMLDYYHHGVGLSVLSADGATATLGRASTPVHPGRVVLVLVHAPELRHAAPGHAGLFHTAVLFEQRSDLAAALYSVATRYPRSFTGSADHLVSEAFYFDDPEGNGVELYADRPRETWTWQGTHVQMATNALDPNQFIASHLAGQEGLDALTTAPLTVGHVHLKVGDVDQASAFYIGLLGFEETARFGSQALFVAAGRYHHHVGMNTWQSRGAGPRTPALGLGQVSIDLADADQVAEVAARLRASGTPFRDDGATLLVDDPWKNLVTVAARG